MHVVVDDILTNYQIFGEKKEKTLLILHGWQRSLNEWVLTAKELAKKYKVIVLDLPGFGATPRPANTFSIYDYATFVEHFLDKLSVSKVTLIGHSFGGRIGIILGAKTKLLEKLILVDAAGVEKRSFIAKVKIVLFKFMKVFLSKNIVNKLRNSIGSTDYKTAESMRDIFIKVINEDLTYLLPKVDVPTVLIWGEHDMEVALWKTKRMKEMIKGAKFRVVWGSGHSPHLEKPREFMEILQENI